MAEFLDSTREQSNTGKLLLIGLVVLLLGAGGFALFYRHVDHPPVVATASRVLTLPLHVTYGGAHGSLEPGETEDAIYVLPVLRVHDDSDVPLFLKDMTHLVTLADGREASGRLIGAGDRERLFQVVPQLKPLIAEAGVPPLDPEQKIQPNATAEGYAIFLYPIPIAEWNKIKNSSVRLDFYHQDSVTIPLPRQ